MNQNRYDTIQKIYKVIMLIVLTSFITFMITSLLLFKKLNPNNISSTFELGQTSTSTSVDMNSYVKKIKSIIDNNYLWKENINEEKLKDAAIEGYVKGLGDKYTEYIPASEMKEFTEEITGNFTGIGIYMVADEENGKIIVVQPIPDSPAEKAGIKPGDAIINVDGKDYSYEDFYTIADHIKGEEGTKVNLIIERDGKEISFEITRAKIEINSVLSKLLDNNIGYVKLPSFDSESSKKFKEKVDALIKDGAKSLILDLRNDGGGIVSECTEIADLFLDKDLTIMTTKDNKKNEEISKTKNKKEYDMPMVILVNENTASASEILTAALKDNNRAKVIGTKTYGKGVIQSVITLSDGSGLKITTAEYFTPNGTEINKKGITPDIEIKLPDTVKSVYSAEEKEDTQLQKATEELNK